MLPREENSLLPAQIKRVIAPRAEAAIRFGHLVESFDRPAWLYRLGDAAPTGEQPWRPPRAVTDADIALCGRLVEAYRRASSEAPPASGMWGHDVFEERHRALHTALTRGEPAAVAGLLASMFRSDFVIGMAPGSLGRKRRPGPLARLIWLASINKLVALAEATAAVRLENPEQGAVAPALRDGVDDLVVRIERRLGISLDFPDVGAAYGSLVGGRLITPETPDQIYGAARLRDVLDEHVPPSGEPATIVEIGGGYGGMAYWLLQMVDARYVILDLPIIGVLQGYFLSQALGHDAVAFHGEPAAQVTILPGHALASVAVPFDVLANKDSLPEIAADAAVGYLAWGRSACRAAFYSYNQEAAAPFDDVPQNVVCELVEQVGGFRRVRRDASWLRRGYVEEVFLPTAAAGR